jgi:uncharacterized membrane protein
MAAVALPQVFHYIGVWSGSGALPGATFLPMHIPVFVAALMGGPVVGLIAGALSPLVSFAFTSAVFTAAMPSAMLLPYMTLELTGYGLAAGMLFKAKTPVFVNLIIAQAAGRALRAIAVLAFGGTLEAVSGFVVAGLPGILLQWALIPLLVYRLRKD